MTPAQLTDRLCRSVERLSFTAPVETVYNPLVYARAGFDRYLARFGARPKRVLFFGMNPGPWGMAQTGVPFGEIRAVREWMGIEARIDAPATQHPKRPVLGFDCRRSEVSGKRLWGWAASRCPSADDFFGQMLVLNYCPLIFFDRAGRNITPDRLPLSERRPLLAVCDQALAEWVDFYAPGHVVGIGRFAAGRCRAVLDDAVVSTGVITHPSPANPRANAGWAERIENELDALGIDLPGQPNERGLK